MKRTLIIFLVILIGLYGIFSFLDRKGEYVVEQIIWKTNKKLVRSAKNPETTPPKVFNNIIKDYEKIIVKFPHSQYVPRAYLSIGEVYVAQKSYTTAREKFQEVFVAFPNDPNACAEAASSIGKTYELEGDWENALKTYKKIIKDFPLTDIGLSAPFYIAYSYQTRGNDVQAQIAYAEAIPHYQKISEGHPNSPFEYKSLKLLSECYVAQKEWHKALDIMKRLLLKYPSAETAPALIQAINWISITQLQNYDMALDVYNTFIESHPDHPANKILKEMTKSLEELKRKDVKVDSKI